MEFKSILKYLSNNISKTSDILLPAQLNFEKMGGNESFFGCNIACGRRMGGERKNPKPIKKLSLRAKSYITINVPVYFLDKSSKLIPAQYICYTRAN